MSEGETHPCGNCKSLIVGGDRFFEYSGVKYHDRCFLCQKCRVPLGGQAFFTQNESMYCEKDYDALFGTHCQVCREVIDGQMVEAMGGGGFVHPDCLRCGHCNKSIGGEQYFPENNVPYCSVECKNLALTRPSPPKPAPAKPAPKFSPVVIKIKHDVCGECGNDVLPLDKLDLLNKLWHKKCFKCQVCKTMLTAGNHMGMNGKPYCKAHYPALTPTSLPL